MKPFDLLAHAVRAKEIFSIVARNGFADLLHQAGAPPGVWRNMLPHPAHPRTTDERIRMAAEELGPAFVKFGQLLSMRPDVLPQTLILELRKLQDRVKALPFSDMRPVLDEALGRPHGELFADFDETAAASASLAQVYRARLRADGREVAVKVQRPGIKRTIEIDLGLAGWIAGQLNHRSVALRPYDLPTIVEEVRKGVLRELDFRHEARNQEYFNAINPYATRVFAPAIVRELSSECVLVMEWVEGTPVGESALPAERLEALAASGATSLIHQVLVDGFFHADPHAGNVIVAADGRLAFIDWGMAGHLTRRLRYALADFWIAAVEQDAERLVRIAAELAPSDARPDLREMEKQVMFALREELNFAIGRQQLGRVMLRLLFILGTNGIFLSRDFSLMAKAVLSIEEVGRALSPSFDLRSYARPVLEQMQRDRWSPRIMLSNVGEFLRGSLLGLKELPLELRRLARRLEHDNLTVNLQHRGLEPLQGAIRKAANQIALGVIVGSLIIGSSLIVRSGEGPRLFGFSALGTVGYLISALFGFYVIYDIVRHGGHK
ncbi:MAG TPA: AarF/UbiB family protein [Opitutaceae bacterium]|nr:AarF/UbiB family protein [Opitutaceae bacterium]